VTSTAATRRCAADDAVNYIGPEVGVCDGAFTLPEGAVAEVSIEAISSSTGGCSS
jgi:hypothetical protein